jgi:hypothetical protein
MEPTPDRPFRRYVPRVGRAVAVDATFKPGFFAQMKNFVDTRLARVSPNTVGCTLSDALRVLRLCETIEARPAAATIAS